MRSLLLLPQVYLASQCHLGPLNSELYRSGALAVQMGVEAGPANNSTFQLNLPLLQLRQLPQVYLAT